MEEGKPQAIKFFAAGDPDTAPPLHIGFLLDTSGSMEEDIKDVRTAAMKFLNAMEQAVDITLVDFDTEVRVARYAAADYPRLIERIRGAKAGRVYRALRCARRLPERRRQADRPEGPDHVHGRWRHPQRPQPEGRDRPAAGVGRDRLCGRLPGDIRDPRAGVQRQELDRFAQMTGGQAFFPVSVKEIDKMYDKIQREIAARYSIGYMSSDERTNGAWRHVEIRLKRHRSQGGPAADPGRLFRAR